MARRMFPRTRRSALAQAETRARVKRALAQQPTVLPEGADPELRALMERVQ